MKIPKITEERRELNFQKYYKEYAKGVANVYTPKNVRDDMIKFVSKDDKVLVIFNLEFVVDLLLKGHKKENILFLSDDENRNLLVDDMNVTTSHFKHYREITKLIEEKHFNIVLTNSPTRSNLIDLRILKLIYEFTDKIVILASSLWLFYHKPDKLRTGLRKMLKNDFKEILNPKHIFSNGWGKMIFYLDKDTIEPINFEDFDFFGTSDIYRSIKFKVLNYPKNVQSKIKCLNIHSKIIQNSLKSRHFFQVPNMSWPLSPIYRLMKKKGPIDRIIEFQNETEKNFFIDYLKTDIARFCHNIYNVVLGVHLESIPDMPSYTHGWTNEQVAKEIGLTDQELKWIVKNEIESKSVQEAMKNFYLKYLKT